jgi:predicted metal-dependent hydrolase
VIRAVREAALEVYRARAAAHCARLRIPAPTVALSNAHTRWGSCTSGGHGRAAAVRVSWRLALTPFEVADYVVAHECAHLLEQNHGPRFWTLVRDLVGDPAPHRAYLRREGPRLHGFGRAASE